MSKYLSMLKSLSTSRTVKKGDRFLMDPRCLKMTQNVAFEFFNFGIFHQFFVLLKVTCLVTLFDRKLQVFKNSPKWTTRFARNVKCNFFCDFQTLCLLPPMGA